MFIGSKQIKQIIDGSENTPGGNQIQIVEFEDGSVERFSKLMLVEIQTDAAIDASTLRDKRIVPVVKQVLGVLMDWGIKMGELSFLSSLLNESLQFNEKQALLELWGKWMPKPSSPEDVDLVTIDRVLKSIQEPSPFKPDAK